MIATNAILQRRGATIIREAASGLQSGREHWRCHIHPTRLPFRLSQKTVHRHRVGCSIERRRRFHSCRRECSPPSFGSAVRPQGRSGLQGPRNSPAVSPTVKIRWRPGTYRKRELPPQRDVIQPPPATILTKTWLRFRNHLDRGIQVVRNLVGIVWEQLVEEC